MRELDCPTSGGMETTKKRKNVVTSSDPGKLRTVENEERELAELEMEVKEMADKLLYLRRTEMERFVDALSCNLLAQRPVLPDGLGLSEQRQQNSHSSRDSEEITQGNPSDRSGLEADQEILEKLSLFKTKASSNLEKMPKVLDKLKACIARMEKVDRQKVNVHPVFKKKREY